MSNNIINASPTKEFFIDTLIKDVSVAEAILDLIDNAIDGYTRNKYTDRKKVAINLSKNCFEIWDNCGGIDYRSAANEVFRFGLSKKTEHSLGVYGIGLKRSIFKIGSNIIFESDDLLNYFRIDIDVDDWKKSEEWEFKFTDLKESTGTSFTKISISNLHKNLRVLFDSDTFHNELSERISKAYFLFIKNNIDIILNDTSIEPFELDIGFSEDFEPAHKSFSINGIEVSLTAGPHPEYTNPGWYIFCNKRLIILGDRTELTGWGKRGVPTYHNKFNRFKGFAYIDSDDPQKLPWNTSKTGIEINSYVYLRILSEMQNMTIQYTKYMSKVYPTEREETIGVDIFGALDRKPVHEFKKDQVFKAPPLPKAPRWTSIQYEKPLDEVKTLKKCIGRSWMTNKALGILTFDYYKEMECPDDD